MKDDTSTNDADNDTNAAAIVVFTFAHVAYRCLLWLPLPSLSSDRVGGMRVALE